MSSTKSKILQSSIRLFNKYGLANVRLQQIADETGISVGNLAYHFKSKDVIISSVYDEATEKLRQILTGYIKQPTFDDFNRQISEFCEYFTDYYFCLSDLFLVNQTTSEVQQNWEVLMNKMVAQLRMRLEFHVKNGDLKEQPSEVYDLLAENIWMTTVFWFPQQKIRNKPFNLTDYKTAVWLAVFPYLTAKGISKLNGIIALP